MSFAVAMIAAPLVLRVLLRHGVLDVPNHRSSHVSPVPRGGGIACLAGVLAGLILASAMHHDVPWLAVSGAVVLALVGLADDQGALAAAPRLGAQVAVGALGSAVVQGAAKRLDQSANTAAFSAYARSKVLGELLVQELAAPATVIFRPPSVHALDRRVTRMTAWIARSPISSVARPGSSPSPQTLLKNVAAAIAFLATSEAQPPAIVSHPSEGLTTASVLTLLGGRQPLEIPRALAKATVSVFNASGKVMPQFAANARRVEMLWFGQSQAPSWLTEAGWSPPAGHDAWRELGRQLADGSASAR